ncbi:heterokaryon incompatibility [Fusarium longipes]|uniref:Heterokaryon incompatibility n=1 Tax=Fusarium longipes TaxID=694270 RepID=A0A395T2H8_9HYPO|nr:heterokaryon incompatibility [Fusarium longipes]
MDHMYSGAYMTIIAAAEHAPIRRLSVPTWPDFGIYANLGFLFGLPKLYLDHALLWQPLKGTYLYAWSPESGGHRKSGLPIRRPTLPSWAWCGWECFVDPDSFLPALNYDEDGQDKTDISNSWRLRKTVIWEHAGSAEQSTLATSNHISASVTRIFFFPAATLEIEYAPVTTNRTGFYLAFANPVLVQTPLTSLSRVIILRDIQGKFSGMIRIAGDSTCQPTEPIEFIAISQGSAKGKCLRSCYEEKILRRSKYADPRPFHAAFNRAGRWVGIEDKMSLSDGHNYQVITTSYSEGTLELPDYEDDQDYHFYNVLWVQRGDNDVAYRAGYGRVLAEAWERNYQEDWLPASVMVDGTQLCLD